MYCPRCGSEETDSPIFCRGCGLKLEYGRAAHAQACSILTGAEGSSHYADIVSRAFQPHLPNSSVFTAGQIPPKKEENARKSCGLRPDETVIVLVDCTIWGSARDCLLFTSDTLYCHNAGGSKSPGAISLPYREFPSCQFREGEYGEVQVGHDRYLAVSTSGIPRDRVIAILCTIKADICGGVSGVPLGIAAPSSLPAVADTGKADRSKCPNCHSGQIAGKSSGGGGGVVAGAIVGGVLGGLVGAMIGGAVGGMVAGKSDNHFECKSCGHKWDAS